MASVLFGYVGGYAFGEWGTLIGSLAGYAIDSQFLYSSGGEDIKGPRLEEMRVSSSAFGRPIEVVYGTARVAGNIIWATDIEEEESTEEVGGGGACGGGTEYTTYTYYGNFAVGICKGPVAFITKVWANKKLIWDATDWENNDIGSQFQFVPHLGLETQLPDPIIMAYEGISITAHRGLCYITFNHYPLEQFGNQLPSMEFEVTTLFDPNTPFLPVDGTENTVFSSDHMIFEPGYGFLIANAAKHWYRINCYTKQVECHVEHDPDSITGEGIPAYQSHFDIDERGFIYTTTECTYSNSANFCKMEAESFRVVMLSVWAELAITVTCLPHSGSHRGDHVWAPGPVAVSRNPNCPFVYYADMGPGNNNNIYITHRDTFLSPSMGPLALFDYSDGPTGLQAQQIAIDQSDGSAWIIYSDGDGSVGTTVVRHYHGLGGPFQTGYPGGRSSEWDISDDIYAGNRIVFDPVTNQLIIGSTWGMDSLDDYKGLAFYDADTLELNGRLLDDICGVYSLSAFQNGIHNGFLWVTYSASGDGYKKVNVSTMTVETEYAFGGGYTPSGGNVYNPYQHATYTMMAGGNPSGVGIYFWDRGLALPITLDDIVTDLCENAGIDSDDIDVTDLTDAVWGYKLNQRMAIRAAMQPLMNAYFFEAVESDAKLKFIKRGQASILTITEDELASHLTGNQRPVTMEITRQQEAEMPREVEITYQDYLRDYDVGTQRASRQVCNSELTINVNLPINLSASDAKQIAEKTLWFLWLSRCRHKIYLPPEYIRLDPCDVITITEGGNTHVLRIEKATNQGGVIELTALPEDSTVYTSVATGTTGDVWDPYVGNPGPLSFQLLDIPMLRDMDDLAGFYLAAQGYTDYWRGAVVYSSPDAQTWTPFGTIYNASIMGRTTDALGDTPDPTIIDRGSTVTVTLTSADDSLTTITEAQLLNEGNPCLIGDEIICFQTATDNGDGTWTISNLLRGRRGTEWATDDHVAGDRFILLESSKLAFQEAPVSYENVQRYFYAVSFGMRFTTGVWRSMTPQLATLMPYSPARIKGTRASGSEEITLTWVRRSRIAGGWFDEHDVPLGETTEAYEIAILNAGGEEIVTITATEETATITALQLSGEAPWTIIGDDTEAGEESTYSCRNGRKNVSLFTLSRGVTGVTGIRFHSDEAHAGTKVKGIIYASSAGTPGALEATTDELTGIVAGWNDLTFASPITLAAGDWFIGTHADGNAATSLGIETGTNYYNNDTYADGPADPFGTLDFTSADQAPMYLIGNYPPELNIEVYQMSATVGRGFPGEATI